MTDIEIKEVDNISENNAREKLNLLKKEVYDSIAKEYNISNKTTEKLALLKKETGLKSFDNLKNEINLISKINPKDLNNIHSLTSDRLQSLYNAISGAEKITNIEFISDVEIIKIGNKSPLSKKLFPKLYEKSINPEKSTDQIMGFCLGGLDSCSTTIGFLIDIGAGITLTPKHTYLIISGKGEYKKLDKKIFMLAFIITSIIISYLTYIIFY